MDAIATSTSLPTNLTSETRVLHRFAGQGVQNVAASPDLTLTHLHLALPIRTFYAWRGKRNLEGLHYLQTTGNHIPFESRLEHQYLLTADFDPDIVAVAAQPLAILWPHDTPGRRSHVPDFFVRHANGDGTVVDVRAARYLDKAADQFNATQALCDEIGWHYQVWTGADRHLMDGITFVSGYRADRCVPAPELEAALVGVYAEPVPLEQGLPWAAKRAGVSRAVALAGLYHLVWRGVLAIDMTRPLSLRTPVWAKEVKA